MRIYMFGVDCEEDGWKFLAKMPENVGGGLEIWGLEDGRSQFEYPLFSSNKERAEQRLAEFKAMSPKDVNSLFPDPCDHGLLEDMVVVEFSAEGASK